MPRSWRSTARIKKSGSQIRMGTFIRTSRSATGPRYNVRVWKDFVSNPNSPVHMVVPLNIIRAKRVFGPENGISLKASLKKTLRSPPQDDRRICMRTGNWAFRLRLPRKKFSGPLSGQPHVFKDCGTATGSLETACKERRQTLENRRSGLFNPGCGSKNKKRIKRKEA